MPPSVAAQANALEESAGVMKLRDRSVLAFSGEDAHTWLGGQVTNQVAKTKPGDAVYALFTNAKGKILADAFVLHVSHGGDDDLLYAVVPTAAREALLESFDKYIVMEDVEVAPREDLAVVTVQGPSAREIVAKVPEAAGAAWPCDRLGTSGCDVVVPSARADALVTALRDAGAVPVDEAGFELARLRLAVPRFGVDFDAASYPQEAGLGKRAVSFTKGCYLGQEVVCMLESRGKVSKRLVLLEVSGGPPAPGAAVEDGGASMGRVTSAATDPEAGASLAMAMVKAAVAETGHAVTAGGTPARVARVPD